MKYSLSSVIFHLTYQANISEFSFMVFDLVCFPGFVIFSLPLISCLWITWPTACPWPSLSQVFFGFVCCLPTSVKALPTTAAVFAAWQQHGGSRNARLATSTSGAWLHSQWTTKVERDAKHQAVHTAIQHTDTTTSYNCGTITLSSPSHRTV